MTIYKNHKTFSQPNHQPSDISLLKKIGKDPEMMIKRSDKCKSLVMLPKAEYIYKAQTITNGYETVARDPALNKKLKPMD